MIRAVFHRTQGSLVKADISGHAGFARYGEDIVCASVTSAVQMTANGITEILGAPATVKQADNRITIELSDTSREAAQYLESLQLHLGLLAEQFENNLQITTMEV